MTKSVSDFRYSRILPAQGQKHITIHICFITIFSNRACAERGHRRRSQTSNHPISLRKTNLFSAFFIFEEAEKATVRRQHHRGAIFTHRVSVGFHRPIKREEFGILTEAVGIDTYGFGVTGAPDFLRRPLGFRYNHCARLLSRGTDFLCLFLTRRTEFFCLTFTL